ncbi:PREDICTED: putative cyclin-D6-1 [Prunus dulcis]|uniref:B-like cyclin n=1 Tax=Prunus dulcis TaxID=3755 RepID=A0A5E4G587_PRUDU|nr:putative cyclin-D6-1 [Prunus dulcis]VVA34808.1 PREDICTED: putative cyclin-D6-1 [Prunus dulcis]
MRSFSFPSLLLLSSNCCSNVLSLTASVSTQTSQTTSLETQNQAEKMDEFGLQEPHSLASFQEHNLDTIPDLFASESDHMPSHNSLSCSKDSDFYYAFRLEAISLFLQAQYSCNLDPFIPYLAINYLDRFLSKRDIPEGKPWVSRLLEVSCLSLAAKVKNTPFSATDFQRGEGFIFDAQTIHKMELLILDTLDWRMRSITPFSFLSFFLSFLDLNDQTLTKALKSRASDVIFNAHNEIKIVEFKPSIIAASAALSACQELLPLQFPSFKASISSFQDVNKESLFKCLTLVQEMIVNEGYESMLETLSCTTRTAMSVVDRQLTKSDQSQNTYTSSTIIAEKRDSKRRRLNGTLCSENRFRLSHHFQKC